ncbi:MAG TPA: T9SS type A sorting domain-containing protein [Bacteroidales bacterium]|nr:T9SS type A sorting domain-containing protein [Bacteroidales bacterium]
MNKCLVTILTALLASVSVTAQIEVKMGKPLFPVVNSFYDIGIDRSQLEMLMSVRQTKDQPYRFAVPSVVSLKPGNSGILVRTENEIVWVVGITSKGALSLNAIMRPFRLPQGGYLYVYDAARKVVRGAFTNESAAGSGVLPVLPVPGDSMIVECHFPGGNIPADCIEINKVSHDFIGFFGNAAAKDRNYGTSDFCENDLLCSSDANRNLSARSVCRILIDGDVLCTGTLINNTGKDLKAYLLTANHCISTPAEAAGSLFIFNYISPWCNGPDIKITHSISGATLLASNSLVDFSLLELTSFPPLVFRPYLAGWNISETAAESTYVIHHPSGDVMKISTDVDPPVTQDYPESGFLTAGFWEVLDYETGATEFGSSGAALFGQDDLVRGTLTGGKSSCTYPVSDYYGKLCRMFDISTLKSKNLKSWLDPSSTGTKVLSGRDPYAYNLLLSDTLHNIERGTTLKSDILSAPGYGYSTGINSDSLVRYAEFFNFREKGEIAWVKMNIVKSSYISTTDSLTVYIFEGDSTPGAIIASKTVKLADARDNYEMFVDFDKTVPVYGPFYIGYREYYRKPLSGSQSQFALYHSPTLADNSLNTAWFNNGREWLPFTQHPSFPNPVSLAIEVVLVRNSYLNAIPDAPGEEDGMKVFPNPFCNSVTFSSANEAKNITVAVYDNSGSIILFRHYENVFPGTLTIDMPNLSPGIYHYRLTTDFVNHSGTIIKGR